MNFIVEHPIYISECEEDFRKFIQCRNLNCKQNLLSAKTLFALQIANNLCIKIEMLNRKLHDMQLVLSDIQYKLREERNRTENLRIQLLNQSTLKQKVENLLMLIKLV
jgi:hypothetical protein